MKARWHHVSVAVTDVDVGMRFFADAFGFQVGFLERGMRGQIATMLGLPDAACDLVQLEHPGFPFRLELIAFRTGAECAVPPRPVSAGMGHLAVQVEDFAGTLARLKALGAEPVGAVTHFNEGDAIYLRTPFGVFLEVEQMPAAPESAD